LSCVEDFALFDIEFEIASPLISSPRPPRLCVSAVRIFDPY